MVGDLDGDSDPWSLAALAPYGLTPPLYVAPLAAGAGINNQVRVVRTGAGQFLWKRLTHGAPERALVEHRLLAWLAGSALPFGTPQPLPTGDGATLLPFGGGEWQALFRWLPGQPLDRHDPVALAALGAALGVLHNALANLPVELRPTWTGVGNLAGIHPLVPDPAAITPRDLGLSDVVPYRDALAEWRAIVRSLDPFLAGPYRELPRQVIHGDFGPGNALASGTRVTAILDFEFALYDVRALDVASGLSLTLRYRPLPLAEELALSAAFCAGYVRGGALTPTEVAALPRLMLLREVVGFTWWLGRALADGDVTRWFARLPALASLRDWLVANERPWLDAIERAIAAG